MSVTNWTVYTHTTPDGKMFVGITDEDVPDFWNNGFRYKNHSFFNAIVFWGWNNIKHNVVLQELSYQKAKYKMEEMIHQNKTYDKMFGYNIPKGHRHMVRCITTKEVYQTIKDASKVYDVSESNIAKCCKGKLKSAGKWFDGTPLKWEYVE